jgi:hypothetical protein
MYKVTKPGSPVLKLEQRLGESISYTIDCSDILSTSEIIFGVPEISHTALNISNYKTSQGKFIKFTAEYSDPLSTPYMDYAIQFKTVTSFGSTKVVPITIRVYK